MAGKEFLESIEIKLKQAIKFIKTKKKDSALKDELSEKNIQAK